MSNESTAQDLETWLLQKPARLPGARWWKCDLHVHSEGSKDYLEGRSITPQEWVDGAIAGGIEVIGLTDHNGGPWVTVIQAAAEGSGLTVFPGIELTVSEGVHLLALLDPVATQNAVQALACRAGIPPDAYGDPQASSTESFMSCLRSCNEQDAVCIAAHVNDVRGLIHDAKQSHEQRLSFRAYVKTVLESPMLSAIEIVEGRNPDVLEAMVDGSFPDLAVCKRHACLESSDAHKLADIGRFYTWIKMETPNLEELRLALRDAHPAVMRGSLQPDCPNRTPSSWIRGLRFRKTKYLGRIRPLEIKLSPWLNAVVGSRGTGKSTIIEFTRQLFHRMGELPDNPEFAKYRTVSKGRRDEGLLLEDALFEGWVEKDGQLYRVAWDHQGTAHPISYYDPEGDVWRDEPGKVAERFPIKIFSQKQIYELSRSTGSLLRILDESADIGVLKANLEQLRDRFLVICRELRATENQLKPEETLRGQLQEVERSLSAFEQAGGREVLTNFKTLQLEQAQLNSWREPISNLPETFEPLAAHLETPVFEASPNTFQDPKAAAVFQRFQERTESALREAREKFQDLLGGLKGVTEELFSLATTPEWKEYRSRVLTEYEDLKSKLSEDDLKSGQKIENLVERQRVLKQQLAGFGNIRAKAADQREQKSQLLIEFVARRRELTAARNRFLDTLLETETDLKVRVESFADETDAEFRLREILQCEDRFDDEFKKMMDELYSSSSDLATIQTRLQDLKHELHQAADQTSSSSLHGKLQARLAKGGPDLLDRVELFFPEDRLAFQYRNNSDDRWKDLSEGSPGQKCAAILRFLLSQGSEPLLLDQPEDDLDNSLITELVVQGLQQCKGKRQVIVVTHNPNIVVNGDAENIAVLESRGGQTQIESGGLSKPAVRDRVCRIMEGGREALKKRYNRMIGTSGDARP